MPDINSHILNKKIFSTICKTWNIGKGILKIKAKIIVSAVDLELDYLMQQGFEF